MKKWNLVLVVALIVAAVAGGFAAVQPGTGAAQQVKGEARIDLIIVVDKSEGRVTIPVKSMVQAISNIGSSGLDGFSVDSFFDVVYASNIGSSGLDGFIVDSFFDLTYKIDAPSDTQFDTEIIAMSLSSTLSDPTNPGGALDAIRKAVEIAGGTVAYGHVTVLK